MIVISEAYKLILSLLKSDKAISSIVTEIYSQLPKKASFPCMCLYINSCKVINTFSNTFLEVYLTCNIYSYSVYDTLEIIDCVKKLLDGYVFSKFSIIYRLIFKRYHNIYHNDTLYSSIEFLLLIQ
ncbi:hypothetical protein HL033_04330 [Neoehrlichia mikurensis]|uniref:DUF3168 domain-containing protein n=1 Tax=Neoehrlichia mikurensis TaxID=89586 RepID=A0A9Q9BX59_9RICK|nr:hypothetical protein [Neoehrlichia mikurensis]QXK91941.1 hypothetical protein IAH97_04325 [Neoehrlichia mikurensis]QXK93154.1 hypothetical protein HUN61_04320 [Neoehrlichia mikurensis]QXK93634.1 hypothetical protein HL033_04330 [Neoehrlichia mikurensis]UTO55411.1 hypothetical protein LUA82_04530 [Neoehrlichia mikurensis]UTO56330.1 hypothetical protein LUA81_04480 [Neoehrlichia mikurensis]